jgi:MYXO-CTERM domain-containing protein
MTFLTLRGALPACALCLALSFHLHPAAASAQPPYIWNGDGYGCHTADSLARCEGDPPTCEGDTSIACTRWSGNDYCAYADQDVDVTCCDGDADCLRGRCVSGYPNGPGVCVLDDEDPGYLCYAVSGASEETLNSCYSTGDSRAGTFTLHERYGDGDCDDDGIINSVDECDCEDGMGKPDGCPPTTTMPDGGASDAGAPDGSATDAGSPDVGPNPDGATGSDATTGGDSSDGLGDYRGEGGCQCRTTATDPSGGVAFAVLLVGWALRRRRVR